MPAVSFLLAVALALGHVFAAHLERLEGASRGRWLSLASGGSVAYVFLHLLPELAARQPELNRVLDDNLGDTIFNGFRHGTYLVALVGLAAYYGLARFVKTRSSDRPVLALHVLAFALYTLLIGHLLFDLGRRGWAEAALFAGAMALHVVTTDFTMVRHHAEAYVGYVRWILAASVLVGWTLGALRQLSDATMAAMLAFLAGGLVLNTLKEELPDERESHFGAFALGAGTYAVLLAIAG